MDHIKPTSEPEKSQFTPPSTGGCHFITVHSSRKVTIYPIQDHELESLDDASGSNTLWNSIGAFFVALFGAGVYDALGRDEKNPMLIGQKGFLGFCFLVSIFSFFQAWVYRKKRKGRLQAIKDEVIKAEVVEGGSPMDDPML